MKVARSIIEAREILDGWRRSGSRIGLVPTMGYFHDGHLELMHQSVIATDKTVVSLFVNPTQFGPGEDLALYPKDFDGDYDKAHQAKVDLLFCPGTEEIYRQGHKTQVSVRDLTAGLCGADRPVHFAGVATVVTKLFNIIRPDYAFFGQKDFQQLRVIIQLVNDLDLDISVVGVPIVREEDGLAMSSRNAYLNDTERQDALVLYRALKLIKQRVLSSEGTKDCSTLISMGKELIENSQLCSIDYLSIVDEDTLIEMEEVNGRCRALGAIKVNQKIRLIDNVPLYK